MNRTDSSAPPVFVVGCARSGTTLLYHTLVSSGGFADYRAETHFYDMVLPRYGSLEQASSRVKLLDEWLESRQARTTELTAADLRSDVVHHCRTGGDILNLVMGKVAESQGVTRWAECTPLHLLYMDRIKSDLPEARFIHILRDGRDVALSMSRVGWVNPLWWDRGRELLVAAWEWEWRVKTGREIGRTLGDDYIEVRFEDLVNEPERTLQALEPFVKHPLDYRTILENAVGTVARPNTAFRESDADSPGDGSFNPVQRWKRSCSKRDLAHMEATVGSTLSALDYPTTTTVASSQSDARLLKFRKRLYQAYRSSRQWLKDRTPLSRLLTRSYLENA